LQFERSAVQLLTNLKAQFAAVTSAKIQSLEFRKYHISPVVVWSASAVELFCWLTATLSLCVMEPTTGLCVAVTPVPASDILSCITAKEMFGSPEHC
jgi:hypothetical protein